MTFTLVLICLLVQRWFHFGFKKPCVAWFECYSLFVSNKCSKNTWWDGFGGLVAVFLPLAIAYLLTVSVLRMLGGDVFYYLLSLFVLWYYMDASIFDADKGDTSYSELLLIDQYKKIFALIFWVTILGPLGVIFYAEVVGWFSRVAQIEDEDKPEPKGLQLALTKVVGVLDFVPARLLGLTYALVGHFLPIFKIWRQHLLSGFTSSAAQCAELAMKALDLQKDKAQPATSEQLFAINQLVNRALLVWLFVMALFTIGHWWA